MNVGIRFHDTPKLPFESRVESVAEQGFGCVQLALYHAFDDFAGNAALTPGFAAHIKRTFERNSVDLAVLGCYMNPLHPEKAALVGIYETYAAHLRFASWLGGCVVGTETGCPNAEYRHVPECQTDACFELFIKNIAPVVEAAERLGVVLGIEPVAAHSIYDAKRARRALDVLASRNVRIIFDPVNLLNAGNAASYRDIFAGFTDLVGEEIAVLHLKDFILDGDGFRSVPFGFGQIDYSETMAFVKRYKPHIHASLEDTKPENAATARKNAQNAFAEAR
ncbi:MAG: sugar phosphate isomerase/epimerase [Clostridiales bacterium]|jgi:sugar phosphate isomerase/epimerase|nr:sugar phosphate isomerase/epimerase [Clostridiales bacterium]